MKIAIILASLSFSIPIMACPKGTTEYEGNCASEIAPEQAVQTYVPSDEKPPRSGLSAEQRKDIHIDSATRPQDKATVPDDMSGKLPDGGVPKR